MIWFAVLHGGEIVETNGCGKEGTFVPVSCTALITTVVLSKACCSVVIRCI